MSENVIEQFADDLRDRSDMQTYEEVADELQAATDPREFMPRLDEWPEWANEIIVMMVNFRGHENGWEVVASFLDAGGTQEGGLFGINLPPGIDPRIKVSREDMKAWEARNG